MFCSEWCNDYNNRLIDPKDIQGEIDSYMEEYDRKVEEEEKRLKEATQEDDEGWVTVTKKYVIVLLVTKLVFILMEVDTRFNRVGLLFQISETCRCTEGKCT